MDELQQQLRQKGEITFEVRVNPSAPQTRFKEMLDANTMKVDIAAAPERGKANQELILFLAEEFDIPKHHVEILAGQTSKSKIVRLKK